MPSGLHTVDLVVLVCYLIGITGLGIWMGRNVRNVGDYFMPRRFGKAVMLMHAFGTGTASDQAVSVASKTFTNGLSGIWFQWQWLFATPFYWLLAPIMRRFRAVTTADVLRLRFDQSVAILFAVVGIVGNAVKIGLLLKGSAALVESGTGGVIDGDWAIGGITLLFVVYGMAGGLAAAIVTDFIQGILTVIFSFMLLPFIWQAVGGMTGIRESIEEPALLSLVAPGEIGVFYIAMFSLQALLNIIALPHTMGVCGAGRNEFDGRFGFMFGNVVKRLCTVAWCLTGIAALAWYLQSGVDPATVHGDDVYGNVARAFLPEIMPGLLGVFLAAILAGVMSSCDSVMVSAAGLFTENVYRPFVRRQTFQHFLGIGRLAGLVVVVGGMAFAYWVPDVIKALQIWLSIAPMIGIPIWMSFFWRGITPAGAWASTLAGFATWFLLTQQSFIDLVQSWPIAQKLTLLWTVGESVQIYEPWRITIYCFAAVTAAFLVSSITKQADHERLDRFYGLMRTPVQPGEVVDEPCSFPQGMEPADRRMLVQRWGLEIPVPSRTSVWGFAIGWLCVGLLIGSFYWLSPILSDP